jgi:hypothetical protein
VPDLMQTYYRNYDQALGRWTGVDPDAQGLESLSSYNYSGNNPVMFNDPLGNLMEQRGAQAAQKWLNDHSAFDADGTFNMEKLKDLTGGGGGIDIRPLLTDGQLGAFLKELSKHPDRLLHNSVYDISGDGIFVKWSITSDLSDYGGPVTTTHHREFFANPKEQSTPVYDFFNKFNSVLGTVSTMATMSPGTFSVTKAGSISLKYYYSGWRGGGRALIKTAKLDAAGTVVGRGAIGLGFVFDTYEFVNGGITGSHYATNTVMGAVGAFTPVGFVTVPYFLIDGFYPGGYAAASRDAAPVYNQMNRPNAAPPQVLMGMP